MTIAEWDQRYRNGERGEEREPAPLVRKFVDGLHPGRALDLACGGGRHSLYLAKLGWAVTAVDGSPAALEILERRAEEAGVPVRAVLSDLEQDNSVIQPAAFDLVLVCYYLQRSLFPAIQRAIRPAGMVIAIVHIPEEGEEPNEKCAAPGELRELFAGFHTLHNYQGPPNDAEHRRPVAEIVATQTAIPPAW
jgi:SAM-dependent methyltransferase